MTLRPLLVLLLLLSAALQLAIAAESVILSEFMADNATGLRDENGDYSDWIEVQNDGTTVVNMAGWALTDDPEDPDKWEFPSVNLTPGGFLTVFASGKDRRVSGAPLHTNFSLSVAGEYLALVRPGGTVATEFAPQFPAQFEDRSYGIGQNVVVTQLVAAGAPARILVPANDASGSDWTTPGFSDTGWTAGSNAAGYETTVPGFAVTNHKANVTVSSINDAEGVIATPSRRSATHLETKSVINYFNTGGDGHYGNNNTFPGFAINVDVEDFVVEAVGSITIPSAGPWSFGVNSDDGFSLTVGAFTTSWPSPRGPADTVATFNFPAAGDYSLRLVFYERGGGAGLELFAAPGALSAWNTTFRLAGDTAAGGLAVRSIPTSSSGGYRPLIVTDLQLPMFGVNASAYLRIPFTVTDIAQLSTLTLKVKYDDGFAVFINGQEVARRNAPASLSWNSAASAAHPNAAALVQESIDVSAALGLLGNGGGNVLAIHGLNAAPADTDFLMLAELAEFETIGTINHFFATATPGAINASEHFAFVDEPQFSQPRGLYDAPLSVALTCSTPGADIRYTTNGSAPTASTGQLYSTPIPVSGTTVLRATAFKAGFEPSRAATQSFVFPAQVIRQPALPPGFPATWGAGVNADYEMDPNVVNQPAYSGVIVDALKSIPTLSIVMSMDDLFGASGIYSNPTQEGVTWERGASVEWLDPSGGGDEFQINCGIRAQGGASRNPGTSPKHGFRLLFKDAWGPSKLRFPMFENSPVTEFDTLVLHARFNDAWVWGGAGVQYLRDLWCRDTQLAMGRPSPHGNFVHLYLNGVYWGMYDPGEKPDASFAAHHLGGDKSEYDALNSSEVIDGNRTAWNAMMALAGAGLASDAAYTQIQQYLDVPGLIDYMIINLYAGNTDWPSHNWTAARRRLPGAGFKFFSWDAEWTFSGNTTDVTGVSNADTPGILYAQLRANAEFRQSFGDHVQRHFFNGGVLTPGPVEARWMRRAAGIDQAIIAESARWGDYRGEPPYTRNGHWLPEQSRLRAQYFPQRTQIMIQQFRSIGLFPSIFAPGFNQAGGRVPPGFALQMTNPNPAGAILFTTNGTDPRLPGGSIAAGAQTYAQSVILNGHAAVRARVKDGATWSALMEGTFYVEQDFTALAVTEIMYHPQGTATVSSDEFEFLELKNTGSNPLDLSGLSFTSGMSFQFPANTTLGAGAFFVLARNATEFAARYPGVTVQGIYTGRLDNGGEKLALSHALGEVALELTYGDEAPWPAAPDGSGFSLVPVNPNANSDPDHAANWRASAAPSGSPATDDPTVTIPRLMVNEVLTNNVPPQPDAIELFNPETAPVDAGGWILTADPDGPGRYVIPANTIIPAGGFAVFDESHFNPAPGAPAGFSFGPEPGKVYLFSGDGNNLTGYSHGIEFGAAAAGVSFGRYVNSQGEEQFPAQAATSLGAPNTGPRTSPVVINEIMYHPEPGYDEFIELHNATASPVPLFDPDNPASTWRLNGLGYSLPSGITLPASGFLVLTGIEPADFRAKYSIAPDILIAGPYAGALQDSGERLQLQRPGVPADSGVPFITVDEVRYNDKAPWPPAADGDGPSLQRVSPDAYGDDPVNWFASGLTPGTPNVVNVSPVVTLLSPVHGASFPAVATIIIEASAHDSDGTISRVEYFEGATKLGESTAAPYRFTWSGVGAGTYAISAKVRDNRQATAVTAPAIVSVTVPPPGNGPGLRGEYYDTIVNLSAPGGATPILTRTDAQIGFDWGSGAPHASMGVDTFSVRWTGQVQPRLTGNYTFFTTSDDGVRLWVNGQPVINNWTDHGPTENSGTIALSAGQLYDLRMEFYENGGGAVATLSWSATGVSKELIPQSQLYPAGAPRIASHPQSQTVPAGSTVTFSALAAGTAPLTYQWNFNGEAIPGATGTSLDLSNVGTGHAGAYTATATNAAGNATSSPATLNVTNPDTDGDGLPDAWEFAHGFDPNNPLDAGLDPDGDAQTNREEFLAGSDPRNALSRLEAVFTPAAGGGRTIRFTAMANRTYTVQFRPSLTVEPWTNLAVVPAGPQRTVEVVDPSAGAAGRRFYRVVTPEQP